MKTITIRIEDKKITGDSVRGLVESLKDGNWELSAEKIHPTRSLAQNKFFHAINTLCAVEYGISPAEMKQYLKEAFLSKKIKNPKDGRRKKLKIVGETKKLDTKEFKIFMDKVIEFGNTELNLNIVNTDDEAKMLYYAQMIEQEAKSKSITDIF